MIDIVDRDYCPTVAEIGDFVENPLFSQLCAHMEDKCKALAGVEYSGDNVLPGWNVRFRKGGRTLIRLYPHRGYFTVLIVVGRREKERVETLLPEMSADLNKIYENTREGMGQRWLLIELREPGNLYEDALRLVEMRRNS